VTDPAVITGLGTVGAYGAGAASLAEALRLSRPVASEIERSPGYHLPEAARLAALVEAADVSAWVPPAAARRMSAPSKLAMAALRMAVRDAGLEGAREGWEDAAVVLATSFGPADFSERLFRAITGGGPETASPFHFTESVANAPAAQLAIDCQARGPNVTVTQREAGPLVAVARAAQEVAEGRSGRALAGSVEEMTPLLHALLDRMRALVRPSSAGGEVARPFDRRRDGLLAAEGASVLVLESAGGAAARGARALARVRGGASAFDPTASRVGWGRGAPGLADAAARMLDRLGVGPGEIDLVVSGASGSRQGDRLEAEVLARVFAGRSLPPVLVPKAVTGEYGGGQIAAAVLAVGGGEFGPTAGFAERDPGCPVVPHAGGPLGGGRVLVSSLAAGGAAAWLVLERP
jgi:3-oxoacyl-[acyl-carrier-protein] synthase II